MKSAAYDRAGVSDLKKAVRPRSKFSNKSQNGSVLVIAGSSDYYGAPVLASTAAYNTLAALRIGLGRATLYAPSSILNPARSLSASLIIKPFGKENIGQGNISKISGAIEKSGAIVMGMGIGRGQKTLAMASKIIELAIKLDKKLVIDADAIYSIKRYQKLGKNVILTPHDSEFAKVYGTAPATRSLSRRMNAAMGLAKMLDSCVLMKGHNTIITDGRREKVVFSRSAALATMGTGDVLAGIIGGYAAAGASVFDAGVAGAYLHSRIGDALHLEKGNHIIAGDVVEKIPEILKRFDK